jgi:hypothetical protein
MRAARRGSADINGRGAAYVHVHTVAYSHANRASDGYAYTDPCTDRDQHAETDTYASASYCDTNCIL